MRELRTRTTQVRRHRHNSIGARSWHASLSAQHVVHTDLGGLRLETQRTSADLHGFLTHPMSMPMSQEMV